MTRVLLTGWGSALPPYRYTNLEWAKHFNVGPDTAMRYAESTGVRSRASVIDFSEGRRQRVLAETLAADSARTALERAKVLPSEVDCVLSASMEFDYLLPSISSRVLKLLGIERALTYDLYGGCAQFMGAVHLATTLLRAGVVRTALVTSAEVTTSFMKQVRYPIDAFIFGDGGGAWVLTTERRAGHDGPTFTICETVAESLSAIDSQPTEIIVQPIGGFKEPFDSFANVLEVDERMLALTPDAPRDARWTHFPKLARKSALHGTALGFAAVTEPTGVHGGVVVPHQGSLPVLRDVANALPEGWSVVENLRERGNLSTACVPVGFDEKFDTFDQVENVVALGVGVGFSYAAARLVRTS